MIAKPKVSYCIGVHNEEKLLSKNVKRIDKFLQRYVGKGVYEIVIVDNRSNDKTKKIGRGLVNDHIKYFYTSEKGFGAAFRLAFQKSRFNYIVYTAIDLPFGFSDFKEAYMRLGSYNLIFGSKALSSTGAKRGFARRLSSYIYQLLLTTLFKNKIADTQGSLFINKKTVKNILPQVTADNAFFSTQLALYAQHANLQMVEVPVHLQKDSVARCSRYNLWSDGRKMLGQLMKEAIIYHGGARVLFLLSILATIVLCLCYISFGMSQGLNLYFWRDDWTALWLLKSDPGFYFMKWVLPGRHPGEFLNTFPWAYLFSQNIVAWQSMGVVLKALASLSTGLISYIAFKNKKAAIISGLLFATYFGGLEGFTWISARLSAYLIIFYAISFFFFKKYLETRRFLELSILCSIALLILEPGRSVFFLGLLLFYALGNRKLSLKLFIAFLISTPIGLMCTVFGRTMLGFKSAELVSPYAGSVLQRAESLSAIKSYFTSLSSLFVGQTLADNHPGKVYLVSLIFLFGSILFCAYRYYARRKFGTEILFFIMWIIAFYSAGWISDPANLLLAENRYFTISAVGVIVLAALCLSKLPFKISTIALIAALCFNIWQSELAIQNEYLQRGSEVVTGLLSAQESAVPSTYTNAFFIVTGSNPLRGYVFDWSYGGGLPFALKRGVSNPLQVPVMASFEEVQQMICGQLPQKYFLDNYKKLKPKQISVQDVFSWNVTEDTHLLNTTETTRKQLVTQKGCIR